MVVAGDVVRPMGRFERQKDVDGFERGGATRGFQAISYMNVDGAVYVLQAEHPLDQLGFVPAADVVKWLFVV
jgi:hypothetical protein